MLRVVPALVLELESDQDSEQLERLEPVLPLVLELELEPPEMPAKILLVMLVVELEQLVALDKNMLLVLMLTSKVVSMLVYQDHQMQQIKLKLMDQLLPTPELDLGKKDLHKHMELLTKVLVLELKVLTKPMVLAHQEPTLVLELHQKVLAKVTLMVQLEPALVLVLPQKEPQLDKVVLTLVLVLLAKVHQVSQELPPKDIMLLVKEPHPSTEQDHQVHQDQLVPTEAQAPELELEQELKDQLV